MKPIRSQNDIYIYGFIKFCSCFLFVFVLDLTDLYTLKVQISSYKAKQMLNIIMSCLLSISQNIPMSVTVYVSG